MKTVNNLKTAIGIATLILSAKANAKIENEFESKLNEAKDSENLNQQRRLVGFAPEKALHTLESLAYSGASYFNAEGETQILASRLPLVIQSASDELIEVQVMASEKPGFVKLKLSDALVGAADLKDADLVRLKEMSDYFKLSCHGGGIVP